MAELDIARIKRNVSKMIAQDAPEADIDAYVASEGATPELLRGGVSAKTDAAPAAAPDKGESLPRTLIGAGAGLASMVGGIGETAKLVGAQGVGDKLSQWSEYIAPEGYVSSREKLKQGDITALPRTAAELAPSVGLDLAAMKVGGAAGSAFGAKGRAIGSILGALGSVYGQSLGSDVKETAQENKHDTATAGDIAQGAGTTTAKALINLLGLKAGIASKGTIASTGTKGVLDSAGQLLKRGSVESASNVAQDAVGQLGTTAASEEGPRIKDPASLLASGLTGGAVGAGFSLPRATRDVAGALRERNTDPDAAARVSNRAVQHAGSVDALSNTRTSFDAYSRVKADINTELGEAAKNASLSTDAQNAVNAARSGKALNKTDLAHIDSANDPALSDLARDANEVTRVTSRGNFGRNDKFEGGVTSAAKKVILQHPILAINKLGGVGTGLAGYAAPSAIGPAAATLAGLWALGRGADYMTGARSPGRSYAEKFADGTTSVRMPAAAAPAQQPTAGARPTGPIVAPVPQPWGPIPAAPQPAPGLATPPAGFQTLLNAAVTTINKQGKQQNKQTILQAMPLLQALAAQNSPKQQASIEKQGAGIDAGIADIVRNRPAPPLALPPPQAAIPMGAPAQQLALPAPSRAQLPAVIPQRAPATIRLPEAPQPEPARAPLPDVIPLPDRKSVV